MIPTPRTSSRARPPFTISLHSSAPGHGSMLPGDGRVQPGKASESFEARDAYAVSPYGEGYGFVNNPHDQFGSTAGFNESKTSALADPKPTAQMRVKSGYTGHVPKGRDHVGSTYRMHDNRGTAGKTMVPIPHQDISPPVDEVLAKSKRNLTYLAGLSATETIAGADNQATINVPVRVQKIMEDPNYYVKGTESLHMKKYPEAKNPMNCYTGHVPFARDVVVTTFYGPTEVNNHHGPAMEEDTAGFVRATNPNKFRSRPKPRAAMWGAPVRTCQALDAMEGRARRAERAVHGHAAVRREALGRGGRAPNAVSHARRRGGCVAAAAQRARMRRSGGARRIDLVRFWDVLR